MNNIGTGRYERLVKTFTGFVVPVLLISGSITACFGAGVKEDFLFSTYSYAPGEVFRNPAGVFFDTKRQEVYVADPGTSQIVILDANGRPSFRFTHYVDGRTKPGDKQQGEPRSVAVNSTGEILVVDSLADYVHLLDYRGRTLAKFYPADLLKVEREKVRPTHVAVGADDTVYVAVGGDEVTVLVLNSRFELTQRIGKRGIGKGEFLAISGLWVDKSGKLYTTDAQRGASEDHKGAHCIQVFNPDGSVALSFGTHDYGPTAFSLPHGLAVDGNGNMWIVDSSRQAIRVFNASGEHIHTAGGYGRKPGQVHYPSGIATDGEDRFFVVERTGRRLQGFKITAPGEGVASNKR